MCFGVKILETDSFAFIIKKIKEALNKFPFLNHRDYLAYLSIINLKREQKSKQTSIF
jgi:hypothetical protein